MPGRVSFRLLATTPERRRLTSPRQTAWLASPTSSQARPRLQASRLWPFRLRREVRFPPGRLTAPLTRPLPGIRRTAPSSPTRSTRRRATSPSRTRISRSRPTAPPSTSPAATTPRWPSRRPRPRPLVPSVTAGLTTGRVHSVSAPWCQATSPPSAASGTTTATAARRHRPYSTHRADSTRLPMPTPISPTPPATGSRWSPTPRAPTGAYP
jgi:hypothetical protein